MSTSATSTSSSSGCASRRAGGRKPGSSRKREQDLLERQALLCRRVPGRRAEVDQGDDPFGGEQPRELADRRLAEAFGVRQYEASPRAVAASSTM